MLIKASYEYDKIKVLHAERVDGIMEYLKDLRKDDSNGFTKDRSMRRICSPPVLTIMEYDRTHPGFADAVFGRVKTSFEERQKMIKEFLASDYAKPFMTVERLKHG